MRDRVGVRLNDTVWYGIGMGDDRELIYSLRRKDFRLSFFRGSGAGGQHRNKKDTACRIEHPASGAVATAQEHKSQRQNKLAAFRRLLETPEFQRWHRIQCGQHEVQRVEVAAGGFGAAKIRTYNFREGRVTDHRIGFTTHRLDAIMDGDLDELHDALARARFADG